MPKPAWSPPPKRVAALLCALLFLLNVFDAVATLEFIRRGGSEGNFLIAPVLEYGPDAFFAWKIGIISTIVIIGAVLTYGRRNRYMWWVLCGATIFYAAVACLHVYLLYVVTAPR